MLKAGTVQEQIATPDRGCVTGSARRLISGSVTAVLGRDALHSNLDAAGSADTLSKGQAAVVHLYRWRTRAHASI